ncbi:phage major tail tube protein [Hoeflea sp.]|uniref:phage major tail tube protein n=1 Tax=Hoeflea sp. TaxID=1940281 RepID=UPI003B526773
MSATIHHMNFANLFIGDDDPTESQFLVLKNVKLPDLEEKTKAHEGAGAAMEIDLGMGVINPLMVSFGLEGVSTAALRRFMPATPRRIFYTIRGNVQDIQTHEEYEVKAVLEGRMTKAAMGDFKKSDGIAGEYELKEIVKYKLFVKGEEELSFDYFLGPAGVKRQGQLVFSAAARNLGLA